jgi:hypothetical protein
MTIAIAITAAITIATATATAIATARPATAHAKVHVTIAVAPAIAKAVAHPVITPATTAGTTTPPGIGGRRCHNADNSGGTQCFSQVLHILLPLYFRYSLQVNLQTDLPYLQIINRGSYR